MKLIKILLPVALFGFLNINALEKPETEALNAETADLANDFAGIQTRTGRSDVKSLGQRFGELRANTNRTAAEEQEYQLVRQQLRSQLGASFDSTFPN